MYFDGVTIGCQAIAPAPFGGLGKLASHFRNRARLSQQAVEGALDKITGEILKA